MLDDYDAMSTADQGVKSIQKFTDVVEMQTCCRFVKDKQSRVGFLLTQIEC